MTTAAAWDHVASTPASSQDESPKAFLTFLQTAAAMAGVVLANGIRVKAQAI